MYLYEQQQNIKLTVCVVRSLIWIKKLQKGCEEVYF